MTKNFQEIQNPKIDRDQTKREIGNQLRIARTAAGLTQEQMLERLNKRSVESISNVERGSTLPPIDTLVEYAIVLGIDPASFLEGLSEPKNPKRSWIEQEIKATLSKMPDNEAETALRLIKAIQVK